MPAPMPDFRRIAELPTRQGESVVVRGWVMTTRSSGKIGFVVLRDGAGYLQVVLSKQEGPGAAWEAFGPPTQEASAGLGGAGPADARAPGRAKPLPADLPLSAPGAAAAAAP